MLKVEDPADNFAYDVHQYFNFDWTGTSRRLPECRHRHFDADPRHGLVAAKSAARIPRRVRRRFQRTCLAALDRIMRFLSENKDVWLGWTYWAGGEWWPANYFTNIQPRDGHERPQISVLQKYLRRDSSYRE